MLPVAFAVAVYAWILWSLAWPAWLLLEKADTYYRAAEGWQKYLESVDFTDHCYGYTADFVRGRRDECLSTAHRITRKALRRWWRRGPRRYVEEAEAA